MKTETIKMRKSEAKKEWKSYIELLKSREIKEKKELQQFKSLYYYLKKGMKIINIYNAFKKAGLNKDGLPKLAIARADLKSISLKISKWNLGGCSFKKESWNWNKGDVSLPDKIFNFPKIEQDIIKQTQVPIIPAKYRPTNPKNFHLLWEVKKWEEPPKDPILLKAITKNLFVVFAIWDLTPLERAFVEGR